MIGASGRSITHGRRAGHEQGIGTRVRVAGRWSAVAGYRFQHLSNAHIAERNPGINSNIGYVGLAYLR